MTLESIIVDLNEGKKLNCDNYDIWSSKIQYVFEEKNALEGITQFFNQPEEGNSAQHRRDLKVYQAWKKANSATYRGYFCDPPPIADYQI